KPFSKRDDRDEKPYSDRSKPFERSGDRKDFKKPFNKKFSGGKAKPFSKRDDRDEKPYGDRSKPVERSGEGKDFKKPFDKKFSGKAKPFSKRDDRDETADTPTRFRTGDDKAFKRPFGKNVPDENAAPVRERKVEKSEVYQPTEDGKDFVKKELRPKRKRKNEDEPVEDTAPKWNRKADHEFYGDKKSKRNFGKGTKQESYSRDDDGSIRLNKFIANSGICSRREADELISAGVVSVNGEIMTQLGYKVLPG